MRITILGACLISIWPLAGFGLDDPTKPPAQYQAPNPTSNGEQPVVHWNLSSILIAPDRRVAVINGQLVNRGDFIGAAQVISIEAGRVTLTMDEQEIRLSLLPNLKKKIRNSK